jgi:hypothetical protein
MDEAERQAKLEAVRRHIQRNKQAWLAWSETAAESFVHDLIAGNLIRPDQADFARKIIAPELHDAAKGSFTRVLADLQQLHRDRES